MSRRFVLQNQRRGGLMMAGLDCAVLERMARFGVQDGQNIVSHQKVIKLRLLIPG